MPRWTRDRVARELENFLACRDDWPSWREFAEAGRKGLRKQVDRFGGAEHWALELGVRYDPRPVGASRRWTEERIRSELDRFMAGRRAWPLAREFHARGRGALWRAMRASGGPARWAHRYGLVPPARALHPRWTEERMEAALRAFVAGHARWPTRREFTEAGYAGLLRRVYKTGGSHAWARQVGVAPPPRRPRAR